MTKCLIALGSNLGDRAATLDAAIESLAATAGVEVVRQSAWQLTLPAVGDADGDRPEFLNGAALVETARDAIDLLALLQQIEFEHGRERHERWGNRTLDLDLLLFGDKIIETATLTVPHPRMSFRRFVLEPAVEIVGEMLHPTSGWTLARLVDQLDCGADCVAIASPHESARRNLITQLAEHFALTNCEPPIVDPELWPAATTTWLAIPNGGGSAGRPKLTILLDCPAGSEAGMGPALRIPVTSAADTEREAFAAIEAVWPRLGPASGKRLQ